MMLFVSLVVIVSVGLPTFVLFSYFQSDIKQQFDLRISSTARTAAYNLELPVLIGDEDGTQKLLSSLLKTPDLESVIVLKKGNPFARMSNAIINKNLQRIKTAKIKLTGEYEGEFELEGHIREEVIGEVIIAFTEARLQVDLKNMFLFTIFITALVIGMAVSVGFVVVKTITNPIGNLVESTNKVAAGDLTQRINSTAKDEVGQLAYAFDHMVASLEEITDKLKLSNTELESLNKEMESFVYTVSHDLKSPIVSIHGLLKLVRQELGDSPPGDIETYISHMEDSIRMMGLLSEDLLELSRVGRIDYKREHVKINGLVSQVITELDEPIKEKNIDIRVQPDLLPVIANKKRVYQIFTNLVGNAVKFMPETVQMPFVEIISSYDSDNFVKYTIKNNGDGIDPKHHDRIFKLFQRLHSRKIPGTGMGLALVKKIVEKFGGTISVKSSVGKETSFYFTLPATIKDNNISVNRKDEEKKQ
ncbi:MAG: HAMP domain-containing protein [Planctomycetes bacterium]|nr:HAMP domain-containing protein [Planctomycetota bacterium]